MFRTLNLALDQLSVLSNREKTGHEAIEHLSDILFHLSEDDAYIIERIIDKDPKINIGTKMVNKVWPDLIEKTGYMGCKPYSKDLLEKLFAKNKEVYSQVKMDGQFLNIIVRDGEIEMESRQGNPTVLDNPKFLNELKKLKDCVLTAELTIDGIPRYESNGIVNSLITIGTKKSKGEDASKDIAKLEAKHTPYRDALDAIRITAWDILTVDEYYDRKSNRIYADRFKELEETLQGFDRLYVVETIIVRSIAEAKAHFQAMIEREEEGTVLKSPDGLWVDSKPSYQVKMKKEVNLDLKIVGFKYGKKGTKNESVIASVDVESAEGTLKTCPAGLSEEDMDYVTENMEMLVGKILEVKCSGISRDSKGNYSLMHPVFKHIRLDKDEANTLEECIEIDASAMSL
jgi:ATP-dependent DNA ligase